MADPYPMTQLNLLSFSVKSIVKRHTEKTSTITAVAISCDGELIAIGYEGGFLEILNSANLKPVRTYYGGAKVTAIAWHTQFPEHFFMSCQNGNLYRVCIGHKPSLDHFTVAELDESITDITLNRDSSMIAVASGGRVILLEHPGSEKPEIHHIGDDPAGPHEEIGIFKMPLGVHFMDEFAVAAIYVDRVVCYSTRYPHETSWEIMSGGHAWMGRSAVTANRREIIAGNFVDGVDRYSVHRKARVSSHELPSLSKQKVAYSVSTLDENTTVSGHNDPRVAIIFDQGRGKGSARYKTEYLTLTTGSGATHIVLTGHIGGKPVVLAVNGRGPFSRLYIISVDYPKDDASYMATAVLPKFTSFQAFTIVTMAVLMLAAYNHTIQFEAISDRLMVCIHLIEQMAKEE